MVKKNNNNIMDRDELRHQKYWSFDNELNDRWPDFSSSDVGTDESGCGPVNLDQMLWDVSLYQRLCFRLKMKPLREVFHYQQDFLQKYLEQVVQTPTSFLEENGYTFSRTEGTLSDLYQFVYEYVEIWQWARWEFCWVDEALDLWNEVLIAKYDNFGLVSLPWNEWLRYFNYLRKPWLFRLENDMIPIDLGPDGDFETGSFLEAEEMYSDVLPQTFFDSYVNIGLDDEDDFFCDDFWSRLNGGLDVEDVDPDDLLWVWIRLLNPRRWGRSPTLFSSQWLIFFRNWLNPWYWDQAPKQSMLRRRFFRQRNRSLYPWYWVSLWQRQSYITLYYIYCWLRQRASPWAQKLLEVVDWFLAIGEPAERSQRLSYQKLVGYPVTLISVFLLCLVLVSFAFFYYENYYLVCVSVFFWFWGFTSICFWLFNAVSSQRSFFQVCFIVFCVVWLSFLVLIVALHS